MLLKNGFSFVDHFEWDFAGYAGWDVFCCGRYFADLTECVLLVMPSQRCFAANIFSPSSYPACSFPIRLFISIQSTLRADGGFSEPVRTLSNP